LADPRLLAQLSTSADVSGSAPARPSGSKRPDAVADDSAKEEQTPSAGKETSDAAPAEEIDAGVLYGGSQLLQVQVRDKIEVPVGWFGVGCKADVPKGACFVGHHGDRYVWVMPNHVDDLSQFTLIVLGITKHGISGQPSRGLVFVRR
jgi:hypothetical protein